TRDPIPVISRTNNKLNPSKYKSKLICNDGIHSNTCLIGMKSFPIYCMKNKNILKGTKKTNIPVWIVDFHLLKVGIKNAIISGANIAKSILCLSSNLLKKNYNKLKAYVFKYSDISFKNKVLNAKKFNDKNDISFVVIIPFQAII